jgi:hypothetical protein
MSNASQEYIGTFFRDFREPALALLRQHKEFKWEQQRMI